MAKVLIIEDDPTIRATVVRALGERGHAVATAGTALTGLQLAVAERPDVVLLDLGLPDLDGRETLRMLRAVSPVPIIVVTAAGTETEMVRALDSGADDYIVKPFGAAQLDARIRAVLRRGGADAERTTVTVGALEIDARARRATLDGNVLDLTPREFDMLHYLALHEDEVVTKSDLLTHVWQNPYSSEDKTVDVHLSWLRRKLGETALDPLYLHTVRRVGIRLSAPATPHGRNEGQPHAAPGSA
jgi:DNA-binding response OmpR family regulator